MLVHYRQLGNFENASGLTIENHVFREDGSKGVGIGMTNLSNATSSIFGPTDVDGWNRLNPLDVNNCYYDIQVNGGGTPTDSSPIFYFQNKPLLEYYSFITHWMYVSDDTTVTTFPNTPAYRYDQMVGLNDAGGFSGNCTPTFFTEASGADTDAKILESGGWVTTQAQTFVVPEGINRIVSAQVFATRHAADWFIYRASIRAGGPGGVQIGPSTVSRYMPSGQFKEVTVNWGLDDIPVVAGQTYALVADAPDGLGFNAYVTPQDNYPNGTLFRNGVAVPDRDLFAVVVGLHHDTTPPEISRSTSSLIANATVGQGDPPNDAFTVWNSGASVLTYSITDDVNWLSVTPTAGTSTGEADNIVVSYDTGPLGSGTHNGTITIDAPGASNNPQTIAVSLTISAPLFALPDFDQDNDVDMDDYAKFQTCYTGGGTPQNDPTCLGARLDSDEDVDSGDLTGFINCMTGTNVPVTDTLCHEGA